MSVVLCKADDHLVVVLYFVDQAPAFLRPMASLSRELGDRACLSDVLFHCQSIVCKTIAIAE